MRGARAAALGPLSLRSGLQQHRPAPQKKAYDDSPSALVHANPRQSVLSVRALVRGDQSGLRNLMAIIVVLANFRLVLENLIKYGVLVSPVMWARVLYPGSEFLFFFFLFFFFLKGVCGRGIALSFIIRRRSHEIAFFFNENSKSTSFSFHS